MTTQMNVSETLEILGSDKPEVLLNVEDRYAYLYASDRLEKACRLQGFTLNNYCTEIAASLHWD